MRVISLLKKLLLEVDIVKRVGNYPSLRYWDLESKKNMFKIVKSTLHPEYVSVSRKRMVGKVACEHCYVVPLGFY